MPYSENNPKERDNAIATNAYERIGTLAGVQKRDRPITAAENTLERDPWTISKGRGTTELEASRERRKCD